MLDTAQNIFLITLSVTLAITYLVLLNRIWPPRMRRVHNDVIGWQISILGTIYAVMIGFMLYAVRANFQTAETSANNEANSLVNLFRCADGLPTAQRSMIQTAAVNYSNAVLAQEWRSVCRAESPNAGQLSIMQMWAATTQMPVQTSSEQVILHQAMHELSDLTEHRRIRILESKTQMPTILWAVLILGGGITIFSSGLIGSDNFALHFVLICALSLLISMGLIAIADIDRPFQGSVHVSPYAFARAQQTMMHPKDVAK